ncbi:MAG TPA: cation:proton antiporter [Alphaproteobacteria bacterium]|nr:cation:proton antiporter [Alphaproteobacteria bacterium]
MISVATITFIIAGLLVLVSLVQPAATRLHLPYTVLLAVVGVGVGAASSFLLYTPAINAFNDIVEPLVNLPFNASIFLIVFLPLLLFHAALTIDVRDMVEDAAPILLLAIVAVLVAAAAVGFGLSAVAEVPLVVALLLGAIVATTDPSAVVTIFHELGAPLRLTRLVEGESLLNDAAAIVLFTVLLEMLASGKQPDMVASVAHFAVDFLGGIALGLAGGRVFGVLVPFLGGSRTAEATLALALPYLAYLLGDHVFKVSGVVAVVTAGLATGVVGRVRLAPSHWRYLEQLWDQIGFWAGSLIFITASILVPKLLVGVDLRDLGLLMVVVAAALLARVVVLFALLPLLSALRLSQKVSGAYKLAITWGGLRGAVTLALALAVTENPHIDPHIQRLVAVLATGFVLFSLLVNGLSLRPFIRLLKLDRLSPLNQALRSKVLALSLAEVRDAVQNMAQAYEIAPAVARAVTRPYEARINEVASQPDLEEAISDRDRMTIGLVALANRERQLILDHHAQRTVSGPAIERLLYNTNRILDGAKAEGRIGYNRAARALLDFPKGFRVAHFLHRHFGLDRPLRRQIASRFETLLVRRLVLEELVRFNRGRLQPLLGARLAGLLGEILSDRHEATSRALEALRLQYPEHAEALEQRFLKQSGLRLELSHYRDLRDEGLIGRELYDDLRREHETERRRAEAQPPLDLGLRTEELLRRFGMFRGLGSAEIKALARLFHPRLALPDEKIIRRGDRGTHMFLISSGAVEVVLPNHKVRLGRGDFFGEMALLSGRRRQADVVALGYCQLLTMSAADFRRFLKAHPAAKAEIDRIVEARTRMNERAAPSPTSSL